MTIATPRRSVCANCEGEITSFPVFRRDLLFCCNGCADSGPCGCLYEQDLADDGVDHLGLPFPMHEPAREGDVVYADGGDRQPAATSFG